MPKPTPVAETPPIATDADPPRKRRSPVDVQRDRLTERIARLTEERDEAVTEAVAEIKKNAAKELSERIAKAEAKVRSRFDARIQPFATMLGALSNGVKAS
jgi:hypothetical protein